MTKCNCGFRGRHTNELHKRNGRKNVESGHLVRISKLPQTKAARRKNGRKNVESGQLASIQELPQTKAARRKNGRKNVESGHLARISKLPQTKAARRKNGRIIGRKNVESGQLARARELPQTKAARRKNGRKNVENGNIWKAQALSKQKTKDTKPELHVQAFLDTLGVPYRKHVIIGGFQSDLVLDSLKLSINVDGNCWHHPASCDKERCKTREEAVVKNRHAVVKDTIRDDSIEKAGYEIMIIPPHNPDIALEELRTLLSRRRKFGENQRE